MVDSFSQIYQSGSIKIDLAISESYKNMLSYLMLRDFLSLIFYQNTMFSSLFIPIIWFSFNEPTLSSHSILVIINSVFRSWTIYKALKLQADRGEKLMMLSSQICFDIFIILFILKFILYFIQKLFWPWLNSNQTIYWIHVTILVHALN